MCARVSACVCASVSARRRGAWLSVSVRVRAGSGNSCLGRESEGEREKGSEGRERGARRCSGSTARPRQIPAAGEEGG